jgi:hypothetical protein
MAKTHSEIDKAYRERRKKPCSSCGKMIHYFSHYCTECYLKSRHVGEKNCIDCGKVIKGYFAKRCHSCEQKFRWANTKCPQLIRTGEKHHNWKGGKMMRSGYVMLLRPDHPRANRDGYVLEHILVWEQAHGKPLPKGWIVHHLNGIKNDNRPQNLPAMPNKKHYLVLQAKAKRIQELEALLNGQSQLL